MAQIDKTYHKLVNKILKEGFSYEDPNRKGVKRLQIPSYTFKHEFKDGFPAITTKKLYWKGIVGELLWFLKGDTNIKYLVDNGINIWNKDAYNYYLNIAKIHKNERNLFSLREFSTYIKDPRTLPVEGRISNQNPDYKLGDLGKVYGAQWRRWSSFKEEDNGLLGVINYEKYSDQLSNLIKGLKENPMGTRHIVTAWNPAELDDMALPPCHWSFEILVEPLNRLKYCKENNIELPELEAGLENAGDCLNSYEIPKYQFTLKWHQRSVDTFLGLPFNIASYALLAHILGKMTNMIPKAIVGDLSNVHIYEPHLDAVKEQLSKDVNKYGSCELDMNNKLVYQESVNKCIDLMKISDFRLKNYESYPSINAEMLAYNK